MREEPHALIGWKTALEMIMKEDYLASKVCSYSLAVEEFFMERVSLAFPRSNPWISKFDDRYVFPVFSYGNRKSTYAILFFLCGRNASGRLFFGGD